MVQERWKLDLEQGQTKQMGQKDHSDSITESKKFSSTEVTLSTSIKVLTAGDEFWYMYMYETIKMTEQDQLIVVENYTCTNS